jgi:ribosomal protein S18 acetylase RimI-like enzyme
VSGVTAFGEISVKVRAFEARDQAACAELYRGGLLGGKLADNDSGLDIDDIQSAYMLNDGNHFWVAETDEYKVVGMIGVQHHDEDEGEIKRLRVHPDYRRRGIGSKLIEKALLWCDEHSYLKIKLDTFMERDPALKLFQKFHFLHSRTRVVNGRELHYFYLDIYQGEQNKGQQ